MPISKKYKFKFIHIPRCGGSGIEDNFDLFYKENFWVPNFTHHFSNCQFAPQHFTHQILDSFLDVEQKKWFSFTLVRNPYNRIISEYFYIHKNFYFKPINDFNESHFINWLTTDLIEFNLDHKLPQSTFIDKPVDLVIKLEELEKGYQKLNTQFNTTLFSTKTNSGNIKTKKILKSLSQNTLDLIYNIFELDFTQFNYPKL
jgi:hypothetical protein|tara:strand:- start:53 stop:655 length:603 start_codon:yes stop_codon:yes gene_type:complete